MNDTYFEQIGAVETLTEEQERALALRIENGDSKAVNELVTANLRFVVYLAKQYQGQGLHIDDLISEGNIGLMKAAAKYHSNRNKRFVQHAAPYIRESIERAIRQQTDTMSIDAPIPEGSQNTVSLLHVLENPDAQRADADIERRSLAKELQSSVCMLSPREQSVVNRYYGIGTLKRERVRQIRDQALRNLHRLSKNQISID